MGVRYQVMSADGLLHLAYLLLICAVSAVLIAGSAQGATAQTVLLNSPWISFRRRFSTACYIFISCFSWQGRISSMSDLQGPLEAQRGLFLPTVVDVTRSSRSAGGGGRLRRGLFLAARRSTAIYDHDISIPSHSRIVNEVSGGLRAARCRPHTSSSETIALRIDGLSESCETLRSKDARKFAEQLSGHSNTAT